MRHGFSHKIIKQITISSLFSVLSQLSILHYWVKILNKVQFENTNFGNLWRILFNFKQKRVVGTFSRKLSKLSINSQKTCDLDLIIKILNFKLILKNKFMISANFRIFSSQHSAEKWKQHFANFWISRFLEDTVHIWEIIETKYFHDFSRCKI